MKFNISNPATGQNKVYEINDARRLQNVYDTRISQELEGEMLGDQFAGYVFKIMGGNDKQGFTMKQGVLINKRVKLLLAKGHSCYRPRRGGERKKKSVRGCIVGPDIQVLALNIIKLGDAELPGLTDSPIPSRLGPKRASKIRRLFQLSPEDDVRDFVIERTIEKNGKTYTKRPKVQRLVTPRRLRRKQKWKKIKSARIANRKASLATYNALKAKKKAKSD